MVRPFAVLLLAALLGCAAEESLAQRYNPYAVGEEAVAPVAADGTIQWGTFFKSAQLQRSYERLWNLGACRGTNRAITEPVENNRLVIDRLPEGEFSGVVAGAGGSLAGGVVAFSTREGGGHDAPLFAQLHPAGVSHLTVTGPVTVGDLRPGMIVRIQATVDGRGRATAPLRSLTVVTPPPDFVPDAVIPGRANAIVGTIVSVRTGMLVVKVDAGRLRRLTISLADECVANVDGALLDLVATGDAIEVKGRLWSGPGSTGAGTVFASHVTVTKLPPPRAESRDVAAGAGAAEGRPVQ